MPTVAAANRVEVEVVVEGKGGCGVWALDLRERRRRLLTTAKGVARVLTRRRPMVSTYII